MLNRVRSLNISLAAKCQLLFGAAVVIIIAAALFVPWQRMEQLTEQLNDAGGQAVADMALRQHVVNPGPPASARAPYLPRLIGLNPHPGQALTPWERSILTTIRQQPDLRQFSFKYQMRDGSERFRYATVVTLQRNCIRCHAAAGDESAERLSTTTAPAIGATSTSASVSMGGATTRPTAGPVLPSLGRSPILGIIDVDIPSQTRPSQLLLNRVFMFAAGLFAGTLAIIVFYMILTRLILQPVRVLQETAEKVSQGDLNIRADISSGDEFEQLSETINTMLANLKRSADQLRAINKSLDLKIDQLSESNVALYESNRLKSEFLANVSHELRTPLNSILGFAELLKDSAGGNGSGSADNRTNRYVQNILQSGKSLLLLINDLLDLAKIEAGRMEVRSEPLSLNDLFEGLISILKPLTESKSLLIIGAVAPGVPILNTDAHKLQQVLYNFLSNAIKFSPPGETIQLTARHESDDRVWIGVTDHGPGIDPEQHDVIFEKFRQIDGSVTRQHGGSGLGLAIAKELAQLLGGTIGVQSKPGEGATFSIVLPIRIDAGVQDVRGRISLT